MDHDYQINIPASFMAVHTTPGRIKPDLARDALAERYELCEDLALLLCDNARDVIFDLSITQTDVLDRMHAGLAGDSAVVNEAEAQWVIIRIAELLGWQDAVESLHTRWSILPGGQSLR